MIKKIFKIAGIAIVAVVILAVAYKGTALVKQHFETQRIQKMYTTLKNTGKLRVGKTRYVYLTDYGRSRLQGDMTFKDSSKKKTPAVAYIQDHTRQVTYDYVSKVTLPKQLNKGTVLEIKAPFGLAHSADFKLNLLANTNDPVKYKDINLSLPAKHNKKAKRLNVVVGFNVDKKGHLIQDVTPLKAYSGQATTFELKNQLLRSGKTKKKDFKKLSKTPNLTLPASWVASHRILANFKTDRSQTQPKLRYQATIDGQKVSLDAPTITLKKDKAHEKDWQAEFKLSAAVKQKLLQSKSKRLKITAAYYGTAVESYYYNGNSLSGLYQYSKKS